MTKVSRRTTATAISHLMPNIIQGAHLGVLSARMVTQSQFLVLLSVHARGECHLGTLAKHMRVSMPTMSGMVDRLVKGQYLKRTYSSDDRRQITIVLTRKGQDFLKQFKGIITKRWEEVLKVLNDEEVEYFYRIIEKINASIRLRE